MSLKISISAALLLSVATPALAASGAQGLSERVSFADLNLASPAGIAALDARIDRTIRRVCGSAHPSDLDTGVRVRRCRATAYRSIAPRRRAALAAASSTGLAMAGSR